MTSTLQIALLRGVLVALVAAGAAFFSTLTTFEAASLEQAAIVAGGVFFGTLVARFGGEGAYDNGSTIQRTADEAKAV